MDCTLAVFEALFTRTTANKAWLEGRWGDNEVHAHRMDQDNQKILMKSRLSYHFPDPFAEFADD